MYSISYDLLKSILKVRIIQERREGKGHEFNISVHYVMVQCTAMVLALRQGLALETRR